MKGIEHLPSNIKIVQLIKINNIQELIQMQKRKGDMLINLRNSYFYDIWKSSFSDTFFKNQSCRYDYLPKQT